MICNLLEVPPITAIKTIESEYLVKKQDLKLILIEIPFVQFFWENDQHQIEIIQLFDYIDSKEHLTFEMTTTSNGFMLHISPCLSTLLIYGTPKSREKLKKQYFRTIIERNFGNYVKESENSFCQTLSRIYETILEHNCRLSFNTDLHEYSDGVKTKFRNYQLRAVDWMTKRERNPILTQQDDNLYFFKDNSEKPHFISANLSDLNIYVGQHPKFNLSVSGGFLADEMGLGKTLEIIGLVLKNKRSPTKSPKNLEIIKESNISVNLPKDAPMSPKKSSNSIDNFQRVACPGSDMVTANGMFVRKTEIKGSFEFTTVPIDQNVYCVCGGVPSSEKLKQIECTICHGKRQHMKCVGYEKSDKFPYICPPCWYTVSIQSGSTLIVSPDHIWSQWFDEIRKHAHNSGGNIKVVLYSGIDNRITQLEISKGKVNLPDRIISRNNGVGFIQPHHLAMADIVLVPFSVLNREPHISNLENVRVSSRGHKRYIYPPSPLCCVKWHRICLDEAQMIENGPSRASELLSKLKSDYRWCISGTPVEKSLYEMVGILKFLRIEPFTNEDGWIENFIWEVYCEKRPLENCTLTNILKEIMWRNTKLSVMDELNLPEIEYQSHYIEFSPIEKFVYDREILVIKHLIYQECPERYNYIPDDDNPLSSLPTYITFHVNRAIEKIRQSCVHSSLVFSETVQRNSRKRVYQKAEDITTSLTKSGVNNNNKQNINTGLMTMSEMTEKVIHDVRHDCESILREFIMNSNGLAACHIIKGNTSTAINVYSSIINKILSLENDRGVLADRFQLLHTMENFKSLCDLQSFTVPPEVPISLEEIIEKIHSLRFTHIERGFVAVSHLSRVIDNKQARYKAIDPLLSYDIIQTWFNKLGEDFIQQQCGYLFHEDSTILSFKFRESLLTKYNQILERRKNFHIKFAKVYNTLADYRMKKMIDSEVLLSYQAHCGQNDLIERNVHQKPSYMAGKKKKVRSCIYCETLRALQRYKKFLFCQESGKIFDDDDDDDDNEGDDEEEVDIDVLLTKFDTSVKMNPFSIMYQHLSQFIGTQSTMNVDEKTSAFLFDFLSQEIYLLDKLFPKIRFWWNLYDETLQAAVRIQANDPDGLAYISPNLVDVERANYLHNSDNAWNKLNQCLSKLQFLINVKKSESNLECPACLAFYDEETPNFVLLSGCWHPMCQQCFYKLDAMPESNRKCPLCRISFPPKLVDIKCLDNIHKRCPLTMIHFNVENKRGPGESSSRSDDTAYNIKCEHSSKISAISQEILRIIQADSTAKILIFSGWASVLRSVSKTLEANKISFCELLNINDTKTSSHLKDFRSNESDSTKVLLMSLRLASNGINLTEANHIFFVEPILNAGREAQAISRVHRMGQKRKCYIHWFLVKDTLELHIHGLSRKNASNLLSSGDLMNIRAKRKSNSLQRNVTVDDLQYFNGMKIGELCQLLGFQPDN